MIYQHILARATLEKEEVMETTGTDLWFYFFSNIVNVHSSMLNRKIGKKKKSFVMISEYRGAVLLTLTRQDTVASLSLHKQKEMDIKLDFINMM